MKATKTVMLHYISTALRLVLLTSLVIISMIMYVSSIANAAVLNDKVIVSGDVIKLGDVFLGVQNKTDANYILGPAPLIGKSVVLNNSALKRLSDVFKLGWSSEGRFQQVVVTRASTAIEPEQIQNVIENALKDRGYDDASYGIAIRTNGSGFILPGVYEDSIRIDELNIDRANNSFSAKISAPATGVTLREVTVTGAIQFVAEIPVVNRRIDRDEVIKESDISFIRISENQIAQNMALNKEDLIGKTPRRFVSPNRVVYTNDLELPELIKRGDRVTMLLRAAGMMLTVQGRALEDGAMGETIKAVNLTSNRTIDGYVSGSGMVEIIR